MFQRLIEEKSITKLKIRGSPDDYIGLAMVLREKENRIIYYIETAIRIIASEYFSTGSPFIYCKFDQVNAIDGNQLKIISYKIPVARNFRDEIYNLILNNRMQFYQPETYIQQSIFEGA